jgi:phosphomannomutase
MNDKENKILDIKFGTDGWRGRIAEDYTFDNVRRCAQGFAQYLIDFKKTVGGIVVGHDRRFASEHFAAAAAEVLAGNGIRVHLTTGPAPTPVISYAVVAQGASGAINITASHNPPTDNGFKVRDEKGGAIAPDGLTEIEARIPPLEGVKRLPLAEAEGLVRRFDPATAYLKHLATLIDVEPIRNAGLTVAYDAMWGSGAGWLQRVLTGGSTRIVEIHGERNPLFPEMIRPEPIPPNVHVLLDKVTEIGADVGIAHDGDADRIGAADENGVFINQLQVYGLLALYFLEVRGERGPIVKTLSTTSVLEKLGEIYDVPVYQTGVGFKFVAPKMVETDALIGGEESGGYAFRGHVPERDGILAALYLLDMMVRTGKKPSDLLDWLYDIVGARYYYDRIDTRFPADLKDATRQRILDARPDQIAGLTVTDIVTIDGFKYVLEDGGWLLIRFSGTEPIIRVYCETTYKEKVPAILEDGMRMAGLK